MALCGDSAKGLMGHVSYQRMYDTGTQGTAGDKEAPHPPHFIYMEIRRAWYGLVKFIYFGISSFLISPGIPAEMLSLHTWIHSSSRVPNHFFLEREERGVFFFLDHYPGNLIHTEYNGKERGRLDRGLEEIMKFVHIQASWKVPPLSPMPPPFSSHRPAFPPPQKTAQCLLLRERWRGRGATLRDDLVPICVSQSTPMISVFHFGAIIFLTHSGVLPQVSKWRESIKSLFMSLWGLQII